MMINNCNRQSFKQFYCSYTRLFPATDIGHIMILGINAPGWFNLQTVLNFHAKNGFNQFNPFSVAVRL